MARIFISHSSANNAEALALRDWLVQHGWDDLFLDIDPHRGLVAGQRWLDRLQESAHRCKAVLFVLSRQWLRSQYCIAEFMEARRQERPLFAVLVDDTRVDDVPAEMRGVWHLTDLTRGSRFETFSVQPPPDYAPVPVRFSHEGLESLRLGLAQAGLTSFDTESFRWPAPGFEHEADGTTPRRPYRGLKPVDIPDAGVFFGRDADLVRALDRLTELRDSRSLVVILGASGSGKSSFLRAGLLPRLTRDDHHFLPLPIVRPRGAAMWGDEGLLAALEAAHRKAGLTITRADLKKDLKTGGASLLHRLADLRSAAAWGLPASATPPTLVLPIDQAEELFTTVRGEDGTAESGLFLTRLAEILRHAPETLALVTIRSDAYEPLQTAEALAGLPRVLFNLPPLAAADYRSVIEGPAERSIKAGRSLTLEPELTRALLNDAQGSDALPLLGFTLERLYVEHGGDGKLTVADYEALGGVQGSIEAAVAEAFADPEAMPRIPAGAAEREALLKRAFVPHLMGVNEVNGEPVRRTARVIDLPAEARGLIDRLVDRRLLVIDQRGEENVVEVAHEALLRLWLPLRRWLDEERMALQTQQEVARAAAAWNQHAREPAWLAHHGARLDETEAVSRREDFAKVFESVPRAYLDACRQAENTARHAETQRLARQRTMQRRVGVLLVAVAIVMLVGGWLVMIGKRDLARQRSSLIAANAKEAFESGQYDRAMRLALVASQGTWLTPPSVDAEIQLGRAAHFSRLEAQLTGHDEWVMSATFSPDGRSIVTAVWGKTAHVWSKREDGTWKSVALEGHRDLVSSAVFSPDGTQIVTASDDKTARVWSQGADGAWHSVALRGHRGTVRSAAFSPDGAHIVTASEDKTARVWSQGKDKTWRGFALEGHDKEVLSAAFSPDGVHIVTASRDSTARVWSQGKGGIWYSIVLRSHQTAINSAAFSAVGTYIITTSTGGETVVWSLDQAGSWHSVFLVGHQDEIQSAAFSPDGTRIVTASKDRTARVWSQDEDGTWRSISLEGHQDEVQSAAFSPDGTRIVTPSLDGTARVWSRGKEGAWTNTAVLEDHEASVISAAFSPDGARIVTASDDSTARVWSQDRAGLWISAALEGHEGTVVSAAFSPDATRIVTASTDGTTRMWSQDKTGTWSSTTLEVQTEEDLDYDEGLFSAVFSPDSHRVITASADGTVRMWNCGEDDVWTNDVLEEGLEESLIARIEGASADNTVRVWSEDEEGVNDPLRVHQDNLGATISPDNTRIVTGSLGNTVHVWSRGEDGSWTYVALEGHQDRVNSAALSLDGTRMVTASNDETARVWDIRWLMGPGDWAKTEPLSLPETVCREKLRGSWTTVEDPETGRNVERIAERLLTAEDIQAAPILASREGEDVCAPFLEPRPWWSRLAFWR